MKEKFKEYINKDKIKNTVSSVGESVVGLTKKTADKTKEMTVKAQQSVIGAIDENGNGEVDVEDLIIKGLKVPGIRINRNDFLRAEFMKKYSHDVIEDAIENNPAHAGISREDIDSIANDVIKFERNCVSGISTVLGTPGGLAAVATIPADIIQYYGYMLRAAQKLMYLYGFPEIDTTEKGQKFDSETVNILTICLGVMYGVAGANKAIMAMAKAFGAGLEKQLMKKALTKGILFPICRKVANYFNVHLSKAMFSGFFKKALPYVGGVISGGITFATFKPCCDKLKLSLQDTILSNPNHIEDDEEVEIFSSIENAQ